MLNRKERIWGGRAVALVVMVLHLAVGSEMSLAQSAGGEMSPATQEMFKAVSANNMAAVRRSIAKGADVEAELRMNLTAIDMAIDKGYFEIAHFLLSSRQQKQDLSNETEVSPRIDLPLQNVQSVPEKPPVAVALPDSEVPVSPQSPSPQPVPPPLMRTIEPDPFNPFNNSGTQPISPMSVIIQPAAHPVQQSVPTPDREHITKQPLEPNRQIVAQDRVTKPEADKTLAAQPEQAASDPPLNSLLGRVTSLFSPETKPLDAESKSEAGSDKSLTVQPEQPAWKKPINSLMDGMTNLFSSGTNPQNAETGMPEEKPPGPEVNSSVPTTDMNLIPQQPSEPETQSVQQAEMSRPEAGTDNSLAAQPEQPAWKKPINSLMDSMTNLFGSATNTQNAETAMRQAKSQRYKTPKPEKLKKLPSDVRVILLKSGELSEPDNFMPEAEDEPKQLARLVLKPENLPLSDPASEANFVSLASFPPIDDVSIRHEGLRLGEKGQLGQKLNSDAVNSRKCFQEQNSGPVFCLENVQWSDKIAAIMDVTSIMYRGVKSVVQYDSGISTRRLSLLPSDKFADVAAHTISRYGHPDTMLEVSMPLIGRPDATNTVLTWSQKDLTTGQENYLELRRYDDIRGSMPNTDYGLMRLYRKEASPIFDKISELDFILNR